MKKLVKTLKQGLKGVLTPHNENRQEILEVFERIKNCPLHTGAPDGVYRTEPWVYEAISQYGQGDLATLETGAGASTLFFARASKSPHLVITPDPTDIKNIKHYSRTYAEIIKHVQFVNQSSVEFLPYLKEDLGMILIDGCHGPFLPFMDFYYSVKNLRPGGYVIIDDIHLLAPKVLFEFIQNEPEVEVLHSTKRAALVQINGCDFLDFDWWETALPYQLERSLFTDGLLSEATHLKDLH